MKTRAIAVKSERTNAVGTVELECVPQGLNIVYLGVGAFSDGYVPGAVTTGTRVLVPWAAVREARLEGDQLFLHVDDALSPHNRLLLVNFSSGDAPHPAQIRRHRVLLRFLVGAAMTLSVLVAALTIPRLAPRAGAVAALALGGAASLVLLAGGLLADQRLTRGGGDSATARAALVGELMFYLPTLGVQPHRQPPRPAEPLAALQFILPRSTAAIVITLTASALGAVLTTSWVLRERSSPPRQTVSVAERVPAPPPPAPAPERPAAAGAPAPAPPPRPPTKVAPAAATAPAAAAGAPCTCRRSDSVLWESPIPRLSTLVIERRERRHKDHLDLDLELGVVNNGADDIGEVKLFVQFYERDPPPSSKVTPTESRHLFFQGPLIPGQAIKWSLEAEGTEFEVTHDIKGDIDPSGSNAAPTNRLFTLLQANHRPVRLHGAMMLAYLGDPRARQGVLELREALREDEAPYLDRLFRALGDVRTCALKVDNAGTVRPANVCVHNASADPQSDLAVRWRALDRRFDHRSPVAPPPLVIAEATYKIAGALAPGTGATVAASLDTSNADNIAPAAFEAFADRAELLAE